MPLEKAGKGISAESLRVAEERVKDPEKVKKVVKKKKK